MSKTPVKDSGLCPVLCFSPKELATPNKDCSGVSKTVFTHVSNLHDLLNSWVRSRDKGAKLCKAISALKIHEFANDYYPQSLVPLTEGLLDAVDIMKNIVDSVRIIDNQLEALSKLQPSEQPVILTWSTTKISDCVHQISQTMQKEYRLKQTVTENIAHCRDENLIEVYVSSWEFNVYLKEDIYAYLFAEVGLPGIT